MPMRKCIVILSILLLCNCSQNEGYRKASFHDERTAELQVIGEPMVVGVPLDLCHEGKYLFVLAYSPQFWLHVYDKESGKLVSESIMVGRGPGEGLNFASMDYIEEEQNLYIFDMVLRKSVVYNLDGDNGTARFIKEIEHPSEGVIRKCHTLTDGTFLYEGYLQGDDKDTRLTLSDGVSSIDAYMEFPGIKNDDDKYAFILGVSKADPHNGRYVSGTLYGAVLECFDVVGNEIKLHSVRLIEPPMMDMSGSSIKPKQGVKYGFSTFCFDGDLIYANFIDSGDAYKFNHIATFDWKGREKIRYTADQNILRLCPGEKTGKELYCIVSSPESEFSLAKLILD